MFMKRIPRKLKKAYKKRSIYTRTLHKNPSVFKGLYNNSIILEECSSLAFHIGFINKADENATHTPYKLIGVEDADECEKRICETKRKLTNGTRDKNKN